MRAADGIGDMWTWTAIDASTKLIITWHLGKRTKRDAQLFVRDLSERVISERVISERVQIATDGLGSYNDPIQRRFHHRADHGSEVKDYGLIDDDAPERKYSPVVVKSVVRTALWSVPDPDYITTAHVRTPEPFDANGNAALHASKECVLEEGLNLQRSLALSYMCL